MQNIVVFGIGFFGRKFIDKIIEEGKEITAIIDNNNKNKMYKCYNVLNAKMFLEKSNRNDYLYIIGGNYLEEMYNQLLESGIEKKNITSYTNYYIDTYNYKDMIQLNNTVEDIDAVIFDLNDGFIQGGIEEWTYGIVRNLKKQQYNAKILVGNMNNAPSCEFEKDVIYIDETLKRNIYTNFFLDYIGKYNKVTFLISHINNSLSVQAAIILKKYFPEKIKIISIIHSSLFGIMLENIWCEKYIDCFICVNPVVKNTLAKMYPERIYFKETPVKFCNGEKKKNNVLRIGCALRLDIIHKRADLILVLISELEKRNIDYIFDIAGTGSFYCDLEKFIFENKLQDKVNLYGNIEHSKIYDFWLKQDISVNFSETEGCSLSMLESMACGCVNIITNVTGVDFFVKNNENGFIVDIGDIHAMADKIEYINNNRHLISILGNNARQFVETNCGFDSYIEFLKKLIK